MITRAESNARHARVLAYFDTTYQATASDVAEALNLHRDTAGAVLQTLYARREIERWRANESAPWYYRRAAARAARS